MRFTPAHNVHNSTKMVERISVFDGEKMIPASIPIRKYQYQITHQSDVLNVLPLLVTFNDWQLSLFLFDTLTHRLSFGAFFMIIWFRS